MVPYVPFFPRVLVLFAGVGFLMFVVWSWPKIVAFLKKVVPVQRTAVSLLAKPEMVLRTSRDRTNVLILGKGGAGHEAPDLTDTIIFVSYHHPTGKAVMLSLPRDIWIDTLRAKLNSAYYYGNLKREGGGLILAKAAVEEVIDQRVHYGVVVDFDVFVEVVDLLGGLEIEVRESFDDYKYPIPGKEDAEPESERYEHLHFDKGRQVMDGEKALKYVRSRYAEGKEGTDYARVVRQQQVLMAAQGKVLSSKVLLSPSKLSRLVKLVNSSIDTDISDGDITGFIKIILGFDREKLETASLDQGDDESGKEGLLIQPSKGEYEGQWVLVGRDGNWQEVREYVAKLLGSYP